MSSLLGSLRELKGLPSPDADASLGGWKEAQKDFGSAIGDGPFSFCAWGFPAAAREGWGACCATEGSLSSGEEEEGR